MAGAISGRGAEKLMVAALWTGRRVARTGRANSQLDRWRINSRYPTDPPHSLASGLKSASAENVGDVVDLLICIGAAQVLDIDLDGVRACRGAADRARCVGPAEDVVGAVNLNHGPRTTRSPDPELVAGRAWACGGS